MKIIRISPTIFVLYVNERTLHTNNYLAYLDTRVESSYSRQGFHISSRFINFEWLFYFVKSFVGRRLEGSNYLGGSQAVNKQL